MLAANEDTEDTSVIDVMTKAVIYGWGEQSQGPPYPPVTQLRGLDVKASDCLAFVHKGEPAWLTSTWSGGAPKFICSPRLSSVGGTCEGDAGGKAGATSICNWCSIEAVKRTDIITGLIMFRWLPLLVCMMMIKGSSG